MKKLIAATACFLVVSGVGFACDVCVPKQVCVQPAPVCAPPAEEVYYVVPVTKKVMVDEVYETTETRTRDEIEIHTKTVKARSPRLVRIANRGGPVLGVSFDKDREVEYEKKVQTKYTVPVTKTRKVAMEVVEETLVPQSKMRK